MIFAANKNLQHPFLVGSSLVVRPPAIYLGVRLFADAGAALTRDEIQIRVMDVLKLFDKVNAEQVKFFYWWSKMFSFLFSQVGYTCNGRHPLVFNTL